VWRLLLSASAIAVLACGERTLRERHHQLPADQRDLDGDGFTADIDCDDTDRTINPGAPERCNEVDDNCDGVIDVDAIDKVHLYEDADNDGYGNVETLIKVCKVGAEPLQGSDVDPGDCDDQDREVNPSMVEVCWDQQDNDCNGLPDECSWSSAVNLEEPQFFEDRRMVSRWVGDTEYLSSGATILPADNVDGQGTPGVWLLASSEVGENQDVKSGIYQLQGDLFTQDLMRLGELTPVVSFETPISTLLAGDFREDASSDMLVGLPHDGLYNQGIVYLLSGPFPQPSGGSSTAQKILFIMSDEGGEFGADIAWGGEEGGALLAVSAPQAGPGNSREGFVLVFRPDQLPEEADHWDVNDASAVIVGAYMTKHLGLSLDYEDIDGDGSDNLMIAGIRDAGSGAQGSVYLWQDHSPSGDIPSEDADAFIMDDMGYGIGTYTITALGDFTGDGRADVAIGAKWTEHSGVFIFEGKLELPYSDLDDADLQIYGDEQIELEGPVTNVGNVTGTSHSELLLSACMKDTYRGGAALLSYSQGGVMGWEDVRSIFSVQSRASCGSIAVSSLGDQDGDGYPELAIGLPKFNQGFGADRITVGESFILRGWGI